MPNEIINVTRLMSNKLKIVWICGNTNMPIIVTSIVHLVKYKWDVVSKSQASLGDVQKSFMRMDTFLFIRLLLHLVMKLLPSVLEMI